MLTTLFTLISFVCYGQTQIKDTKLKQGLESMTGKTDISHQGIMNNSFIAADGESFLRSEIIVDNTIQPPQVLPLLPKLSLTTLESRGLVS